MELLVLNLQEFAWRLFLGQTVTTFVLRMFWAHVVVVRAFMPAQKMAVILSYRVNFATYDFRLGCRSSLNGNMGKDVQNDHLI